MFFYFVDPNQIKIDIKYFQIGFFKKKKHFVYKLLILGCIFILLWFNDE